MGSSIRERRSSLWIPIDMALATLGLTILFLPAVAMTNELLRFPVSPSMATGVVVSGSVLVSTLYSSGYLSRDRLWNATLVFVSATIGLLLFGTVAVYLSDLEIDPRLLTATVLFLAYVTTFLIDRRDDIAVRS